jgi:hypothetical protein
MLLSILRAGPLSGGWCKMGVANSTVFPVCTREMPHQLVLIASCIMSPRILRKFCDLNFALPASIHDFV